MSTNTEQTLMVTQIVTLVLFICSEYLGWSNCKANSVSEFFIGRCMGSDWFIKKVNVPIEQTLPNIAAPEAVPPNDRNHQAIVVAGVRNSTDREGSGKVSTFENEIEERTSDERTPKLGKKRTMDLDDS